jgi:alcohol dehydrogenase (NADP+)
MQPPTRLGADQVIVSTDETAMSTIYKQFDLIIDAVAAPHDVNVYLSALKLDGAMVMVGLPETVDVAPFNLVLPRRIFTGSLIGGIAETQEMLDFCGKHNITADIEMINMDEINEAYERMLKSDVRYRFVIDMASLKN